MNCAELESLLADYVDHTLGERERASLEQHAARCAACRQFMEDVTGGINFLQYANDVGVPPALITRIAYQAPLGRIRHPLDRPGLWAGIKAKWLAPILQPRLVMGMAMTILSFSMLERCTGVPVQQIQAADLNPVRIWGGLEDKAFRAKDRAVKYYENIRLVYDLEVKLRDMENQQEPPKQNTRAAGPANQDSHTQDNLQDSQRGDHGK